MTMQQCKLALILVVSLLSPSANADEGDWLELVRDGKLSDRWETRGNWHVDKSGVVTLKPRSGETGWRRFEHYIWSKDKFSQFEIEFEYRVEKKGNSGFYFHVGKKDDPVKTGIEVQIFDSHGKPENTKLTDHDSGGVIPGIPPTKTAALPAGEWNRFHIRVDDKAFTIKLNGQTVNEIRLDHANIKDRPSTGFIGFQDHGMPLALRRVRVRSVP